MIRTLAVAAALATTLAMASCSDDSDSDDSKADDPASSASESPSTSESPSASETPTDPETSPSEDPSSSGSTVTGTDYSFEAPEGWGQPSQTPSTAQQMDSFAVDLDDKDGFADNITVIKSPATAVTRQQVKKEFAAGGTKVTFGDDVQVDGSDSIHVLAESSQSGVDFAVEQFYPKADNGQYYVVTFSFSASVPEEDRSAVVDETLANWSWT